jgi:hypothetical protein
MLLWRRHQAPHLDATSRFKPILCGNIDHWGSHSIQEALQTNQILITEKTKKQFRMKKFKMTILSLAIVFSLCAAFATKPHWDCSTAPQFWYNGTAYFPVGANYGCMQGTTTCSYYTLNGGISYSPCTVGTYINCLGCAVDPQAKTTPIATAGHSAGSTH